MVELPATTKQLQLLLDSQINITIIKVIVLYWPGRLMPLNPSLCNVLNTKLCEVPQLNYETASDLASDLASIIIFLVYNFYQLFCLRPQDISSNEPCFHYTLCLLACFKSFFFTSSGKSSLVWPGMIRTRNSSSKQMQKAHNFFVKQQSSTSWKKTKLLFSPSRLHHRNLCSASS